MATNTYFTRETLSFLSDLAANNQRTWFQANKDRYEGHLREPALAFIVAFAKPLKRISKHFVADPRKVGGSLFRIHRDTRFSKDKSPYKTAAGIQFRHERAKDVHAPGFYLHIQPGKSFVGIGIWHPDGASLKRIRDTIIDSPAGWRRAVSAQDFQERFAIGGDSLVRAPRGYDPEHPLIEDIKRKDFIASSPIPDRDIVRSGFLDEFADMCKAGTPFMRFLCNAVGVPY